VAAPMVCRGPRPCSAGADALAIDGMALSLDRRRGKDRQGQRPAMDAGVHGCLQAREAQC